MTLRDKRGESDLLHGRWSDKTGYVYIRLNGMGYEGERQRIHQPIDRMEHTADGLWLPKPPVSDDGPDELRVYESGMGDMRDIILDHPGDTGTTIYRVGVKPRTYTDKKTGKKVKAWELHITDKIDLAQRSLPTAIQGPSQGPGGPPSGGSPNIQSLSQGCTPTPPAGPVQGTVTVDGVGGAVTSYPPTARQQVSSVEAPAAGKQATPAMPLPAAETAPTCPTCGQKAVSFQGLWVHCGREVGA